MNEELVVRTEVEATVDAEEIVEVEETADLAESIIEEVQEVEQTEVTDVVSEEIIIEETEESEEAIKLDRKDVFKPRTDYVSKFEQLADASRKEEQDLRRRRRKPEREEDKPVNTSELLKEKEYDILPEYSPEEPQTN